MPFGHSWARRGMTAITTGTRAKSLIYKAFVCVPGRVVNVSSFVGVRTLNQCSPALQERFRSEDITEEELAGLMRRFVDEAKKGEHKQGGWPETAYGVSKTGLTVRSRRLRMSRRLKVNHSRVTQRRSCFQTLSMILARRLSRERPSDGVSHWFITCPHFGSVSGSDASVDVCFFFSSGPSDLTKRLLSWVGAHWHGRSQSSQVTRGGRCDPRLPGTAPSWSHRASWEICVWQSSSDLVSVERKQKFPQNCQMKFTWNCLFLYTCL